MEKNKIKNKAESAFFRAWELFDATLSDSKNKRKVHEINICRELFADLFFERNEYRETPENFEKYFIDFAILARSKKL